MTGTVADVAMLAAPSNRSRIYLDVLERNDLLPEAVVLLEDAATETPEQRRRRKEQRSETKKMLPEDPDLDTVRSVRTRLEDSGIPHQDVGTLDPNADAVVEAVGQLEQTLLVYSGPGGVILDGRLLTAGPRFLHVHAGVLPDYKGSTTVYYSLLEEGRCGATAFIMNENIDEGPIVAQETYPPPTDPETLDLYYDPWIRAQLLGAVLGQYQENGTLRERPQRPDEGETYFVIHPVLKHVALLQLAD